MESASTIGRGTVVRGSVHGEGDLEILGRVEGSVAVSGDLSIGESAHVKSDVSGRRVTVQGAVSGNVSATEAIVLLAGARVVGDLGAPQIGIRPGALVRGMVSTGVPAASGAGVVTTATVARARPPVAAPARAVAPQRPAPARPASPAARPAPRPIPVPIQASPRAEAPTMTSARVEAAPEGREIADDEADSSEQAGELTQTAHGGPPPPVVPQIRKGAKASLRRKGAR
jgi:cytoskeletal protein CcmA (bactofilin family)